MSESIHVKMPHCWESHVVAYIVFGIANIYRNFSMPKQQGLKSTELDVQLEGRKCANWTVCFLHVA